MTSSRASFVLLICVSLLLSATASADEETAKATPREEYNAGLQLLTESLATPDADTPPTPDPTADPSAPAPDRFSQQQTLTDRAIERFRGAIDEAGPDQELKHHALFNTGMSHCNLADVHEQRALAAQQSGNAGDADLTHLKAAIAELDLAVLRFREALSLQPKNKDTQYNLEVTRRRYQLLVDQLARATSDLTTELDALIEKQRSERDQIRALLWQLEHAELASDPTSKRDTFRSIATAQRVLLSNTRDAVQLAGAEFDHLNQQDTEQLPEEERARVMMRREQLDGALKHLERARQAMASTRSRLHKLDTEPAHRKSAEALRFLQRARAQLEEPLTQLQVITRDETSLWTLTRRLNDGEAADNPWLNDALLNERQRDHLERAREVLDFFRAGVAAYDAQSQQLNEQNGMSSLDQGVSDPKQLRTLNSIRSALPAFEAAVTAMDGAQQRLAEGDISGAIPLEEEAVLQLNNVLERFLEIRGVIELTYKEQLGVHALIAPPEGAPDLPYVQRREAAQRAVARNQQRLQRLESRFKEELAALDAPPAQDPTGQAPQASPEEIENQRQLYTQAELVRGRALLALDELSAALAHQDALNPAPSSGPTLSQMMSGAAPPTGPSALTDARLVALSEQTQAEVEELRKLFYSIVEHLKELARDQSGINDRRALAQGLTEPAEQQEASAPLQFEQGGYADRANLIAKELEKMAESAPPAQPGQPGADPNTPSPAERFGQAASEVEAAASNMRTTINMLDPSGLDLETAESEQSAALQHLATAIQLLEPPKEEPKDQEENKDQEQQDQEQKQDQQQQQDQQQADRDLQAAQDREAQRMRERAQKQQQRGVVPDYVEKDW